MHKLVYVKIIFVLAGILFVARPFMGFKAHHQLRRAKHTLIIVKAFVQARPEYLEEAEGYKTELRKALSEPLLKLGFTIGCLGMLCRMADQLLLVRQLYHRRLLPAIAVKGRNTYLLTGKFSV